MGEISRILVVSRMTEDCRKAVHRGISMAKLYDAELYVIHVVHDPFGYEGWNLPVASFQEEYLRMLGETKAKLDAIMDAERVAGLDVQELVREGDPNAQVLNAIEEKNIDLLIMLAHEEGRLEHFLFGRSTEELVRRMPCSIMLVKTELGHARD